MTRRASCKTMLVMWMYVVLMIGVVSGTDEVVDVPVGQVATRKSGQTDDVNAEKIANMKELVKVMDEVSDESAEDRIASQGQGTIVHWENVQGEIDETIETLGRMVDDRELLEYVWKLKLGDDLVSQRVHMVEAGLVLINRHLVIDVTWANVLYLETEKLVELLMHGKADGLVYEDAHERDVHQFLEKCRISSGYYGGISRSQVVIAAYEQSVHLHAEQQKEFLLDDFKAVTKNIGHPSPAQNHAVADALEFWAIVRAYVLRRLPLTLDIEKWLIDELQHIRAKILIHFKNFLFPVAAFGAHRFAILIQEIDQVIDLLNHKPPRLFITAPDSLPADERGRLLQRLQTAILSFPILGEQDQVARALVEETKENLEALTYFIDENERESEQDAENVESIIRNYMRVFVAAKFLLSRGETFKQPLVSQIMHNLIGAFMMCLENTPETSESHQRIADLLRNLVDFVFELEDPRFPLKTPQGAIKPFTYDPIIPVEEVYVKDSLGDIPLPYETSVKPTEHIHEPLNDRVHIQDPPVVSDGGIPPRQAETEKKRNLGAHDAQKPRSPDGDSLKNVSIPAQIPGNPTKPLDDRLNEKVYRSRREEESPNHRDSSRNEKEIVRINPRVEPGVKPDEGRGRSDTQDGFPSSPQKGTFDFLKRLEIEFDTARLKYLKQSHEERQRTLNELLNTREHEIKRGIQILAMALVDGFSSDFPVNGVRDALEELKLRLAEEKNAGFEQIGKTVDKTLSRLAKPVNARQPLEVSNPIYPLDDLKPKETEFFDFYTGIDETGEIRDKLERLILKFAAPPARVPPKEQVAKFLRLVEQLTKRNLANAYVDEADKNVLVRVRDTVLIPWKSATGYDPAQKDLNLLISKTVADVNAVAKDEKRSDTMELSRDTQISGHGTQFSDFKTEIHAVQGRVHSNVDVLPVVKESPSALSSIFNFFSTETQDSETQDSETPAGTPPTATTGKVQDAATNATADEEEEGFFGFTFWLVVLALLFLAASAIFVKLVILPRRAENVVAVATWESVAPPANV